MSGRGGEGGGVRGRGGVGTTGEREGGGWAMVAVKAVAMSLS